MRLTKIVLLPAAVTLIAAVIGLIAMPKVAAGGAGDVLASMPLKVDRAAPAIDGIIPREAILERISTGYSWIEGPVWAHGSLYFAEIRSNSIRKWTPGEGASIFLQPSGYKGAAPYGGPEPGSNGMTLDARGRLTVAGHAARRLPSRVL